MNIEIIKNWFFSEGVVIVAILVGIFLVNTFAHIFIDKTIRKIIKSNSEQDPEAERKREDTLIHATEGLVRALTWIVGLMMIVSEFGVDIGPLIAAAGVVGVAVGFGGQYLIRDIIAGLFIILENQYRVGDVISAGGKSGKVESLNLRITTIRDLDGVVHHIPNGEVKVASNMTKNYARVNFNIGVAYDTDLAKLESVINAVGKSMEEDPDWSDKILSAPKFLRVHEFADSAVVVKILGDTQPDQKWAVLGELKKRIKIEFDKEGIEIPFPQRVLHQK
jgi:moderate conductance mechanosensitive channel